MSVVTRTNEISLFGTRYPLIGAVAPALASQFAPKMVTGDYTKDSEIIASSWVMSDQSGGIGIKDMVETTDSKRCWWSTCELGYKGHLLLPVLVTNAGNPTTTDAAVIVEYGNALYVAFGADVRRWVEGSASWSASLYTLPAAPTDALVHDGKLYFACGTDFVRFDGTAWVTGTVLAGAAQPSRYFIEWDSKLFDLDNTGQLDVSTNEGVTWVASALSNLPTGYFTSLFLYRDGAGDVVVFLGTKQGVYALDYTNSKWIETGIRIPYQETACAGAAWWRDDAVYISAGGAVHRYYVSEPIALVGPDRDSGLPGTYRGNIVKLLAGHNDLYALMDATSTLGQDLYPAGEYGDVQIYDNVGFSCLLKWNGTAWSMVYLSGSDATPLLAGAVCTADDEYRLWFGVDGKVFYLPLQVSIQNPIEITDFLFGAASEHISPWFDADQATMTKLGTKANGYYTGMSATEYIKLYYGLDYNDDTWTLLTNATFPDGKIDADGEAEFTFASEAGIAFKAIRFKEELVRGSDVALSPDRRWLRLSYIKLLDVKWGFTLKVDCSRNYRFKNARSLLSSLKTALETHTLGEFTFKNGNGSESHQVRIANMNGVEVGGKRSEGLYELQLLAP